ncbi:hypothetical protein SDC9_138263 [bioreactor metagenome]|uniref:Uncharacterized protein n=1 Tax=bioreactor metagenome TaxID=1076179 RepID=A0A645DPA4_9ZZZZ
MLAFASDIGSAPRRLDQAEALEPVQQGIEHAVGPVHLTSGQFIDPFEDRVAV